MGKTHEWETKHTTFGCSSWIRPQQNPKMKADKYTCGFDKLDLLSPVRLFKFFHHRLTFCFVTVFPTVVHLRWHGALSAGFDFTQPPQASKFCPLALWRRRHLSDLNTLGWTGRFARGSSKGSLGRGWGSNPRRGGLERCPRTGRRTLTTQQL